MKSKRSIVLLTIFVVLLVVLTGCKLPGVPSATKGIINGRVLMPPTAKELSRDITGWVPAANAVVTIVDANGKPHTTTTDANGNYSFENISVKANTVVTAKVTVDGKTIILKGVIPNAVAADGKHDAGTMDPESTALALVVEKLQDLGLPVDLEEIKASADFQTLVGQVQEVLDSHGNVETDADISDAVADVASPDEGGEPTPPDGGGTPTIPVSAISVEGAAVVGETLTATPTPSNATVDYEWLICDTINGEYVAIDEATERTYTLLAEDATKYIKVKVKGTGNYTGTKTSDATGPVVEIATWNATGNVGVNVANKRLYEEYELLAAGNEKISLADSNIKTITEEKPDGTIETLTPDTDTTLWFNVRKAAGDYKYTVETNDGKLYEANLSWDGLTSKAITKHGDALVLCGDGVYRHHYVIELAIKVDDTLIYREKPNGDVDQQTINDDSQDYDIYFRPTDEIFAQVEGDHTYLIKKAGVWYESTITYRDFEFDAGIITGCNMNKANIVIPDKIGDVDVTEIGEDAFNQNEVLTGITIPASVTTIGDKAFYNCLNLESVTFEDTSQLTAIGNQVFEACGKLTSISIPDTVTDIGEGAFAACGFVSVTIPNSVTGLKDGVFSMCENLTSVTIGGGVKVNETAFLFFDGENFTDQGFKVAYDDEKNGGAGTYELTGGKWAKQS